MLKSGFSLSFKAKMKLHIRNPNAANSQKWARVLIIASFGGCPKIASIKSVKKPLVEEDSSPFWADKTKIVIKTANRATADIII